MLDPQGAAFFNIELGSDAGPFNLLAGTYTLLVLGHINDPGSGNYTFNVVPVTDGSQVLTPGGTVTGSIAAPGQQQRYTFTLFAAARLYFDSLTNNPQLHWSLDGPSGNLVNNRSFTVSDAPSIGNPVLALSTGNYTLSVSGNGDTTGDFQFRLFDLATATSLTPGTPVNDTLNPANATKAYQFAVGSTGRYFFNYQNSSGLNNTRWRLIDPYNDMVFSTSLFTDQGPLLLGRPGTYTLLVEGYIIDVGSGTYGFNVAPVSDGLQALTLGNVVSGAIATPGI
ncbi:MAG: hypothetical protein DME19_11280 [Verrucomicrobia bacterium]|nr:MAG: hypothetical protein DME19_11280 [Verrucomicrobiota bacterium]